MILYFVILSKIFYYCYPEDRVPTNKTLLINVNSKLLLLTVKNACIGFVFLWMKKLLHRVYVMIYNLSLRCYDRIEKHIFELSKKLNKQQRSIHIFLNAKQIIAI